MIIDRIFSSNIIDEGNGTFSVDTPISYERGFSTSEDAKKFASTYGRIDKRTTKS